MSTQSLQKIRSRCLELLAESFALTNLKFYRQAAHTLRQHNEHLLQMILIGAAGKTWEEVEGKESLELMEGARSLISHPRIEGFFRTVAWYGNRASHPNRDQEILLTPSLVWTLFHITCLCWVWSLHRILGEGQHAFSDILDTVAFHHTITPQGLEQINQSMGRRRKDPEQDIILLSNPSRRFAVHSGTMDYLKTADEGESSRLRVFLFFVYAWAGSELEIPFIEKNVLKREKLTITQFKLSGRFSALLLELQGTQIIFHAGKDLSLDQWQRTCSLITNSKDFFEILSTRAAGNPDNGILSDAVISGSLEDSGLFRKLQLILQDQANQNLAPEIRQKAFGTISEDTYGEYQNSCLEHSGFRQSNIRLISQDQELEEAFTFPLDTWRLFLHPTQLRVRESKSRFLMIKGGPGTGKTVVLLHRIKYLLQQRQSQVTGRFTIAVLIFTDLLQSNIETMLEKLEVDTSSITLLNYHEYKSLTANGTIKWRHQEGKASYLFDQRLPDPERICTDLILDEFQDFPTDETHPVTQLILNFILSRGSLVLAYDEHQAIYHDKANIDYWKKKIPKVEEHELKYCYRMGEEISKVATNHRKIMLDWASRLIYSPQSPALILDAPPSYAFTGSRFYLIPNEAKEIQFNVLNRYIKPLLNRYKPEEIAVIFFQSKDSKGKVHAEEDQTDPLNNLEQLHRIRAMDALYSKGLEFRAGILVGPEPRFTPYKRILNEGKSLKQVQLLNEALQWLVNQSGLVLAKSPEGKIIVKDSGLRFLSSFLTEPKKITKNLDNYLQNEEFRPFFARFGESSRMLPNAREKFRRELHKLWYNSAEKGLKGTDLFFKTSGCLREYLQDRHSSGSVRNQILHLTLSQLNALFHRVGDWSRSKIQALFDGKLDKSMLNLNEFYVAITRFRETIVILNRQSEFDLFPILPGAKGLKEFETDFS